MALPPVQILVFASVPPPVHGQNVMVAALLEGLKRDSRFRVFHINPNLSRDQREIGRWQIGKLFRLACACARAIRLRLQHGPMLFYYVPAPAKRAAIVRDWIVMTLCRPFYPTRIFHWHAVGLGEWVRNRATTMERSLTRCFLGRAEVSLVLAPELADDARIFRPRRVQVVENGIMDPATTPVERRPRGAGAPVQVLFLGLGSAAKGLFRTVAAVQAANARRPGGFVLTFAGPFETPDDETRFAAAAAYSNGAIRSAGFVDGVAKRLLLQQSDLMCFPTQYAHEGQPLVLLEAMAFDLPIVATRWRAIPGMLPAEGAWLVEPDRPEQLTEALITAADAIPHLHGSLRAHFLRHFTLAAHLARLTDALAEAGAQATRQPTAE